MLSLETLYVANQAARRGLLPPDALRDLLQRLAQHPQPVQLVRVLHEHKGVPLVEARALHEAAQRYLRHRWEERYVALLRRARLVPDAALDPLLHAQQAANFTWALGDRLVRQGQLAGEQHQRLCAEVTRQLGEEERRLIEANLRKGFAPVLAGAGPGTGTRGAPRPAGLDARASGRLPVPSPLTAPEDVGGATIKLSPAAASGLSGEWDPRQAASAAAADEEDGSRTVVLNGPGASPDGATDVTIRFDGAASGSLPRPGEVGPGTLVVPLGDAGASAPLAAGPAAKGAPSAGLVPGRVIDGKYTLVREVGRGAMGVVFLAQAAGRPQPVALKVVQGPATEEVRGRFKREILVSQRIQHPHVISVLDAGELEDGGSYMVMEFLEGESLSGLLSREGAQPLTRALALLEQLLVGLEAVHGAGIVHRDLKPENLQVTQGPAGDHIKIVDFGISRFLEQDPGATEKLFVTMKGKLSGTPQYVAPEAVLDPDEVTKGHDVYACGVIAYELLTGVLPFPPSRSLRDLLSDTVSSRPREMDEANPAGAPYPQPIQRLVRRLLEKDPELRPADAAAARAFLAEVRAELEGRAPSAAAPAQEGRGFTARLMRGLTGLFRRSR